MTGLLLLPTLNRIELLKRFLSSYEETKAEIPVWILVDRKDYETHKEAYDEIYDKTPPHIRLYDTKDFVSMGDKVRFCFGDVKDGGFKWVGLLNDDHVCITPEWDKKTEALIDGKNIVSTNDGSWNFGLTVVGLTAWSMPILDVAGFPIFPQGIDHWFIDNVWKAIGDATGCWHVTAKINIEHRHVFCRKMEPDDTYKISQNPGRAQAGAQAFDKFLREEFEGVSKRIMELRKDEKASQAFT